MAKRRSQQRAEMVPVATPPDPNRCAVQFSTSCKSVISAIVSIESLLRQLQKKRNRMVRDIRIDATSNRLIIELDPDTPFGGDNQNGN